MLTRKELEKMKKTDLISFAKENNISVDTKASKNQIIGQIVSSDESKPKGNTMSRLATMNTENMNRRRSYTVDPEDRNKPVESDRDVTAAEIRMSINSNLILTGRITSVNRVDIEGKPIYLASIRYGHYKVSIPVQYLVELTEEEANNPDELKKISENRLGSVVDFKVLKEDTEDGVASALASRIAAMEILRKKMWFAKDKEGEYRIREDQIVQGRITSIVQAGIFVEVAGVETFIPNIELSHVRHFDAREIFSAHDEKVDVYVKKVTRNEETGEVEFEASVKDTKPDERAIIFSMIDDYSLCFGTVKQLFFNKEGEPRAMVWLEQGYPCLCRFNEKRPEIGDSVRVRVKKNEDAMRVNGIIQHISRPQY